MSPRRQSQRHPTARLIHSGHLWGRGPVESLAVWRLGFSHQNTMVPSGAVFGIGSTERSGSAAGTMVGCEITPKKNKAPKMVPAKSNLICVFLDLICVAAREISSGREHVHASKTDRVSVLAMSVIRASPTNEGGGAISFWSEVDAAEWQLASVEDPEQ